MVSRRSLWIRSAFICFSLRGQSARRVRQSIHGHRYFIDGGSRYCRSSHGDFQVSEMSSAIFFEPMDVPTTQPGVRSLRISKVERDK